MGSEKTKTTKKSISKWGEYFPLFKDSVASIITSITIAILVVSALLYNAIKAQKEVFPYLLLYLLVVFISLIVVNIYVTLIIKTHKKKKREIIKKYCLECSQKAEKIIFSEYDLITLPEIIKFEEQLKKGDSVYNYTVLDDTAEESSAKDMIQQNRNKGVLYKIFYTNKAFGLNPSNIALYGEDNLIYCYVDNMYQIAWFDILIYTVNNKQIGYAAINFTPTNMECENCCHSTTCHSTNDTVVYKKLSRNVTTALYNEMNILSNQRTTN